MKADESYTHAADLCRAEGWQPGDLLIGTTAGTDSEKAVRVTAIGQRAVLGVHLADRRANRWFGRPDTYESTWQLLPRRGWRKATTEDAAAVRAATGPTLFDRLAGGGTPA